MGTGPGKHARRTPHTTAISLSISFTVAFAALVTALIMHVADSAVAAPSPEPAPVAVTQPVTQEGRLIAISPDSLTAQGPDGVARTYRVDDQTHGITAAGSQMGGTTENFTVNDEVSIIGVTRGGDNVATTVVHRDVANLNGPPMDDALP
ncbi:hypothetical protein ASE48_17385 [Mycobacterium sp. Root265]|uniref:hypothetical protein n=1 Tax=Mycobacterium sp. Root265 TaxID=1736504 RepID=UPI00070D2139|nr:hypothetical protein [Mycobacterium sp. Root265]KRD05916.1 hypothetical protein ASE48_17385 [Mycobacterium sp. Root265]